MVIKLKKKTTLFSVLVYTLKSNYLLFSYLIPPILLQTYGNSSYLASLACFLVVLLLVFLLPKNIGEINYLDRLNKSFLVKISYYLLQVCQTILFTLLVSYTVGRMFFNDTNILIFIIVSVAIVIYLSTNSVEVIFNSSTFLFIASSNTSIVQKIILGRWWRFLDENGFSPCNFWGSVI